jgi:hypothetical protein
MPRTIDAAIINANAQIPTVANHPTIDSRILSAAPSQCAPFG